MTDVPDAVLELESSWGCIVVRARSGAIISCRLPCVGNEAPAPLRLGRARIARGVSRADRAVLTSADRFIRAAFAGRAAVLPKLDVPAASPFVMQIWRRLQALSRGRTVTYGELARQAGRPRAARAAGSACGRNELPLFIPCHRVLAAGGKPGGFTGGLAWKHWLLERERESAP